MVSSASHWLNAELPKLITPSGISIVFNDMQDLNVSYSILVIDVERFTSYKFWQ